MPKPHKFRLGQKLDSLDNLETCLFFGRWIYLRGRPKHPSIFANMQVNTILDFINEELLYEAIYNDGSKQPVL